MTLLNILIMIVLSAVPRGDADGARSASEGLSPKTLAGASGSDPNENPDSSRGVFARAIEEANRRTVKIYGAGIAGEEGYASGVIVSPDGRVVTVLSLVLEANDLRVVTHDGHIYQAEVIYKDEYRQLALLKLARRSANFDTDATVDEQMSGMNLDAFKAGSSQELRSGDWILAVGNPFKVAEGDEPLSVMKGIVCGRTRLNAVRGTQPFPYVGEVILIDAITSGPGSPGSAIVDLDGRWVGLVGKNVTSRFTNTLLNYALPIEEVKNFLQDAKSGGTTATRPTTRDAGPGYHGIQLSNIAYRRQLPFVRSVAKGSPAATAGVKADDLIVSANGTATPRGRDFTEACERLRTGDELSLIIKRGEQLIPIRLTLTEAPK